jgi:hypothetical protein
VRDIRRAVRRQYSAEEKVRVVIAGLLSDDNRWINAWCIEVPSGIAI